MNELKNMPTTSLDNPDLPGCSLDGWCFWVGGLLALLGAAAIAAPWVAATAIAYVVGFALLAGGVSQLGMAWATFTWRGFWLTLICGALALVAGTAMFAIPAAGVHVLVTFLGILILFEAAAKLMAAFSVPRNYPWGWLLVDGLITALLGGLLLTAREELAGVYLGVIVGINLLTSGLALVGAGWWMRRSV
jgi:uncharacterized membrane protein HdeD (DUF308 family)